MLTNNMIVFTRYRLCATTTGVYINTGLLAKSTGNRVGYAGLQNGDRLGVLGNIVYTTGAPNIEGGMIWIGKDETPPSKEDYVIDAFTNSTEITRNYQTSSIAFSDGKAYLTITGTFTANVDITVKEVGFFYSFYNQTVGGDGLHLMAREVIPNTAAQGEPDSRFKSAGTQFTIELVIEIC